LAEPPITVAYLFTTFPKTSEAFLQRDVAAMQARGVNLRLYSLWGGGGEFHGLPVQALPRWWFFVALLWWIPYEAVRRPDLLWELIVNTLGRRAPSALNFWENMLGAGFTACFVHSFRRDPPDLAVANLGEHRVHHQQEPHGDREACAVDGHSVERPVEPGKQPTEAEANRHGGRDPHRQEPVEARQPIDDRLLLADGWRDLGSSRDDSVAHRSVSGSSQEGPTRSVLTVSPGSGTPASASATQRAANPSTSRR